MGILLDAPGADDHPLKVVVRFADVVDGRREQYTPAELLAVVVRIEAQRGQLAVRRLPWRVEMALSRMRRDLTLLPLYQHATPEDVSKIKLQIIFDVTRGKRL